MVKKLMEKMKSMAGDRASFDPPSPNNPVAMQVSWTPAKSGGANFQTHKLVAVNSDHLKFRASIGAKLFYLVFLLACLWMPACAGNNLVAVSLRHSGGWEIRINRDGGGSYGFGTLPARVGVAKGTFVFADVIDDIKRASSRTPQDAEDAYIAVAHWKKGASSAEEHRIAVDKALLDKLFKPARANAIAPQNEIEKSEQEQVEKFWTKHSPPTLLLDSGCTSPRTGDHVLPSARLTGHDSGGDEVCVTEEGNRTIVDVHSTSGIGRVELTLPSGEWRRPLIVRLHLAGLEAFHVNNGKLAIRTSVLSRPPYRQLCELFSVGGRNGSPLEETSPFWMPLHVENRHKPDQRVIPLEDGYFEITLPNALLDGNPKTLSIQWIDFLRR